MSRLRCPECNYADCMTFDEDVEGDTGYWWFCHTCTSVFPLDYNEQLEQLAIQYFVDHMGESYPIETLWDELED